MLISNDPAIYGAIFMEKTRQNSNIELIASENFVSEDVMEAQGSILTNKYAEGYPGRRYYGGCEYVDQVETLAIERAKKIFNCEYVNVQPHSGSQANMAVYNALLQPGAKILGMDLSHGGHLTHGSAVNFSGKTYEFIPYGLGEEEKLDYDMIRELAIEHEPQMIVAGASAYSRVINFSIFRKIADEVGAILMVDMAHIAGLVAAGLHPNPVEHAHVVTSTTHKTLRGPRGGIILTNDKDIATAVNKAIFPGIQGGPLMHVIAGKAVAFKEAYSAEFTRYQEQVVENAKVLAESLTEKGFRIVSGGTDNHLMLVDLTHLGITGKEAEKVLDEIGITCNKNTIPNDPAGPFVTSGIRLGTPAVTTRGFKAEDMKEIASIMADALANPELGVMKEECVIRVQNLTAKYPM